MTRHKDARRLRTDDSGIELSMTPMIDVTFLLLIFFMCTLRFKTLEGRLGADLPKDVGVSQVRDDPVETLVVRVDVVHAGNKTRRVRDGGAVPFTAADEAAGLRFDHDATRVLRYRIGATVGTSIEELRRELQRHFDAAPERRVRIDPREGTSNDDVVQVLDMLLDVGFVGVAFTGSAER